MNKKYLKVASDTAAFVEWMQSPEAGTPSVGYLTTEDKVVYGEDYYYDIEGTVTPGTTEFSFKLNGQHGVTVNATVIGDKFYYKVPSDMVITSVAYAFANNTSIVSLDKFNVPVPVGSDNQSFFYRCTNLTGATLYNSNDLTRIGANCFYLCYNLTSITIPNTVETINESAFRNCSGLTEVILPASLTAVGRRMFQDCSNLEKVTCLAVTPPGRSETTSGLEFSGTSPNLVIYVPEQSVNAYKTSSVWSSYASIIEPIPTP